MQDWAGLEILALSESRKLSNLIPSEKHPRSRTPCSCVVRPLPGGICQLISLGWGGHLASGCHCDCLRVNMTNSKCLFKVLRDSGTSPSFQNRLYKFFFLFANKCQYIWHSRTCYYYWVGLAIIVTYRNLAFFLH